MISENKNLRKEIELLQKQKTASLKDELVSKSESAGACKILARVITTDNAMMVKDMVFEIHHQHTDTIILLGAAIGEKANLWLMIPEHLVKEKAMNASELIQDIAKEINGGGGGQPFLATAGGNNPANLEKAIDYGNESLSQNYKLLNENLDFDHTDYCSLLLSAQQQRPNRTEISRYPDSYQKKEEKVFKNNLFAVHRTWYLNGKPSTYKSYQNGQKHGNFIRMV
ncbi:MAG: DHHA1 domain-containing protein [Marinilabiliales bacterium]|nr:DHHA1 domain-containing protein [Marinilabiliales bacterium]